MRNADLPGNSVLGIQHHWLKTGTKEAGMGPWRGGIPGHEADSGRDLPLDATRLTDHSAETSPHTCTPVVGVSEDCVNERLTVGAYTGRWIPPLNDCQKVVADIIADCRQQTVDAVLSHTRRGNEPGPPGTGTR